MEEIWKVFKDTRSNNIKNTRGVLWQVSNEGNVKKNEEIYECRLNIHGYKVFGHSCGVHRAVAMLFIPNPNNYNEVDHINGDKLDNRAINLQWCSHKGNMNNPITKERMSESLKGKPQSEESRKRKSKSMKVKNKNRHRVYHDDGTWHMEKNL